MIAGTGSGCGKTTVTLAVLRAMQRRNIPLAAFKCGPDYIDPMFHKAVLGIPSRNLDLFFVSEREVRGQIVRSIPQNGIGVIEGVMGFYDGVSGTTDTASAAHLARCVIFLIFVQYQSCFQQHLQADPVCNSNPLIHLR